MAEAREAERRHILEIEKLKVDAAERARLQGTVEAVQTQLAALSKKDTKFQHTCCQLADTHSREVTALQVEKEAIATKLAHEKSKCTEAVAVIETERRKCAALHEALESMRKDLQKKREEMEEMGKKWRASEVEVERLQAQVERLQAEEHSWSNLHGNWKNSNEQLEKLKGMLAAEKAILNLRDQEVEQLKADRCSFVALQQQHFALQNDCDKMMREKSSLLRCKRLIVPCFIDVLFVYVLVSLVILIQD